MRILAVHKSKVYLTVFIVAASILGWGIWNNYRPQVVYASCADIAEKTSNLSVRKNLPNDSADDFEILLNECLTEAGYYETN